MQELGVDVIERHMREENAPEENIAKMTEIYRLEMIARVSWMLAGFLDTPEKVQRGIEAMKPQARPCMGRTSQNTHVSLLQGVRTQ